MRNYGFTEKSLGTICSLRKESLQGEDVATTFSGTGLTKFGRWRKMQQCHILIVSLAERTVLATEKFMLCLPLGHVQ